MRGIVKTSTIVVATGTKTEVFRSLDEVPRRLRRKLEDSTSGQNAATILIADRRGREEILRAARRNRSRAAPRAGQSKPAAPAPARHAWTEFKRWGVVLVPGAIGLAVWLLTTWK